ncbi:Imm74 family immunity protein [Hymenobacter negativus]|uniref:Uncharacterized protein n=1 Tax=Hymenobacter negativus TaxID=2795026 RepID=A0ABS3QQQ8_9BACT|nr:hypothetical protein [Hymenobacter negativus]
MRLIQIQRGHIKIEACNRTITIDGEGFIRPDDQRVPSPNYVDYVIYTDTLTHWDKPWEHEPLPVDVQSAIVIFLKEHFEQRGMRLAIE